MELNNEDEWLHRLALTFIEGIGPKTARQLMAHFGTAKHIMQASARDLKAVGNISDVRAKACKDPAIFKRAEEEMAFVQQHNISLLFFTEENYPKRLKSCADAPTLLYYQGSAPIETGKMIAIIGTRKNTEYGARATDDLVSHLSGQQGITIVSGLAYGIDAIAHRASLKAGIPTIGVVGHGLDKMYPAAHKTLAKEMMAAGGVLAEFPSGTMPDRTNFPVRNRVVAGLCDVTVIVESDERGGAMITAYLAASYNREVAAFPGRIFDTKSGGPNKLIRMNVASLIRGADDLLETMGWNNSDNKLKSAQPQLFLNLSEEEQQLMKLLSEKDAVHTDELMLKTGQQSSQLAITLLQLEMMGLVKTLPGKMYRVA